MRIAALTVNLKEINDKVVSVLPCNLPNAVGLLAVAVHGLESLGFDRDQVISLIGSLPSGNPGRVD